MERDETLEGRSSAMDDYRSRMSVGYAEEIKCTYSSIYLDKK
jgi:hypothetical protein